MKERLAGGKKVLCSKEDGRAQFFMFKVCGGECEQLIYLFTSLNNNSLINLVNCNRVNSGNRSSL